MKTKQPSSTSIVLSLPGAHYHPESRLVTWHPRGVFDDRLADRMVEFMESEERIGRKAFHRFADLSGLERLDLSLEHVFRVASRRRKGYRGPEVKSAIFGLRMLTIAIGRLYQELMHESAIEVGVFRGRAAAAEWLGVPAEVLEPPAEARSK
jgi:hypothetical protein